MSETISPNDEPSLRPFRPDGPATALGLAVNYLMAKPAFASLTFGHWARVLAGQINRKHFFFVTNGRNNIVGFVGWSLASESLAEAWMMQGRELSFAESQVGDCIVINAWVADTSEARQLILRELRKTVADKKSVYFRRRHPDGSVRSHKVAVNDAVEAHIRSEMLSQAGRARGPARTKPW